MTLVDNPVPTHLIEIKSKFNCDFRRVSIFATQLSTFDSFANFFLNLHHLKSGEAEESQFEFYYNDPSDKELLPINNDINYIRVSCASFEVEKREF